ACCPYCRPRSRGGPDTSIRGNGWVIARDHKPKRGEGRHGVAVAPSSRPDGGWGAFDRAGLQATQEVEEVLFLPLGQGAEEAVHDGVGLGSAVARGRRAAMRADGVEQIGRAAVVQEEDPLAEPPERCGAELVRP